MVTRSLAIVPAILVAIYSAQNMDKLDQLLNILQSVQLPFAVSSLLFVNQHSCSTLLYSVLAAWSQ